MIGSVHGCVSCPVVVRPWEPESLSRPQHPLPSHLHTQSHPYSFSQRASSVHPLPQSVTADDKKSSCSLSPQRLVRSQTHNRIQHHSETEKETSKCGSPKKTGSANGSPQKIGSAVVSPKRLVSVFRSQQVFSEQFERLLRPKNSDISDVNASSQKIAGLQSTNPGDIRGNEFDKEVCLVESHVREPESDFSPPKTLDKVRQHPVYSDKKSIQSSDANKVLPKDTSVRTSSPTPTHPEGSRTGSPQFHRTLSPAPLPSIQDKSKMLTRDLSQELSQISLISTFRPNKVLPSIPKPKLQPIKKNTITLPRSSLSLKRERKQQTQALRKKKSEKFDMIKLAGDYDVKMKFRRRKESVQDCQLTSASGVALEGLPAASENTGSIILQYSNISEPSFQRETDTFNPSAQNDTLPTRPSRDAPTPQSLDSSIWSLGQTAVAPEVDALTTAAAAGDLRKVKSLLAEGVNVNAVNTFGRTAVQVMSVNNTDLAEVLLKAGADPNMQDKGRRAATSTLRTIAHDVADSGNTDMLRCLLRHGADVNLQDRWGNTPLHLAAKRGHLAAVRLLRRGTSLYLPNLQGKTPITLLDETGNPAIKQWVQMKISTVSHLQTLCVLVLRRELGPDGLRHWRKHAPDVKLQRQVLLQSQGSRPHPLASTSTILSSRNSAGSKSLTARGHGNGNGHPLVPGLSTGKQMTDFLTLRDLIPRRLSTGENTSLEVHNTSSGQSNDDVSLCAHATSSLASETGSLFETNLSSIEASQSADDISLPSFDQSL